MCVFSQTRWKEAKRGQDVWVLLCECIRSWFFCGGLRKPWLWSSFSHNLFSPLQNNHKKRIKKMYLRCKCIFLLCQRTPTMQVMADNPQSIKSLTVSDSRRDYSNSKHVSDIMKDHSWKWGQMQRPGQNSSSFLTLIRAATVQSGADSWRW